jgi:hypothetical protein
MATAEAVHAASAQRTRRVSPRVLGVLGAAIVIAILVRPMIFGRTFIGWDWYQHQWYIWHQAESIKANGLPSLFAHDPRAVFNAHFAFYGGTMYAFGGLLTIVIGDPGAAMVIMLVLGFVAAYGGWYWLGRQAGLSRTVAHAPAVLFVTGPYYLAILYATGGLGEFIALSMVSLLLASVFAVLRADRLRFAPAALLAVSVIFFTGSHNLTLLWGTTLLVLVVGVLLVAVPGLRRTVTRRGLLRVLGVAVPAAMVNGWYLLPDVAYASHTFIAHWDDLSEGDLLGSIHMVRPSHVFSLGRGSTVSTVGHFALQLPVLGAAWVLVALALARASWRTSWFRAVLILAATIGALYALMQNPAFVWSIPKPFNGLQFLYRFEGYILLAFAAAVIGAAVLTRRRRVWVWALIALSVWSVAGAAWQLRQTTPSIEGEWREAAPYFPSRTVPNSWDYSSNDLPSLEAVPGTPIATFSPADAEDGDRAETTVVASPGMIVQTNLVAMPQLVHLEGGRFVGRGPVGANFVELDQDATSGAAKLTVSAAHPWPVVGGWILTVLGLVGLGANAVAIARRRRAEA